MEEVNKDLNKSQSVADPDLNKVQVVVEPDLNQSVTGKQVETLADGDDEGTKTVKYEEFKKANEARKAAEEREKLLQDQMLLLQSNQQPIQQQTQQPVSVYDQAKADLGLTGEEYIDENQRGKLYARMGDITQRQNQQSASAFANQQFESSHADFGAVVGLRNPITRQIQPTAEILTILNKKPYLTTAAYSSSQGAYEIVMNERKLTELQKQNTVQEEHLKQQGIDTKLAPVSGAAAAGGAISNKATGVITMEEQLENERRVADGELN